MLGRVVVENGVKKIVPLTADCGSGNPVGTVIAVYSNKVPNGYLPCNGVAFDTAQFPVLYALLGDDHTPDLRECTLVGIGQSDRTMGAHDVYTVGQFKDDQLQNIAGKINISAKNGSSTGVFEDTNSFTYADGLSASGTQWSGLDFNASKMARTGTTTHGKQVGVNWCIKATSGINENQADNVLSALSPVDVVALNNVHSVTSNAVYNATLLISNIEVNVTGHITKAHLYKVGKVVFFSMEGDWSSLSAGYTNNLGIIPEGYRPAIIWKGNEATLNTKVVLEIPPTGIMACYNYDGDFDYARVGNYFGCWITNQ